MSRPAQPGRRFEIAGSASPVGVLIIHEDALFRTGVRALTATTPLVEIVADAVTVGEAEALDVSPDVILASSTEFYPHDATVALRLQQRFVAVPTVVIGPPDGFELVRAVIAAGAAGYLTTKCHPDDLADALCSVARGGTFLEPALGVAFARWHADRQRLTERLSAAEREVVRWVALGYTNREIATMRRTSARTVEGVRAGIGRKLGFGDRASLVRFARSAGLT
jgi:two-component system, NarL family, response regulator NreC